MRPNPDGFAPEVRAEMEKLFWWGIRALLSLTRRTEEVWEGDRTANSISRRCPRDFPARYGVSAPRSH